MKIGQKGSLYVITGCMFSGKTEEFVRILRRQIIARRNKPRSVVPFKPDIDNRYSTTCVVSHSNMSLEADLIPWNKPELILEGVNPDTEIVGIDEVQFFNASIVGVIQNLLSLGIDVYVAGLKQDFRGEVFGAMGILLILADSITMLTAVCDVCGAPATNTQRLIDNRPAPWDSPQVLVGGLESYGARCNSHHELPGRPKEEG
jgi:thymidine kinase